MKCCPTGNPSTKTKNPHLRSTWWRPQGCLSTSCPTTASSNPSSRAWSRSRMNTSFQVRQSAGRIIGPQSRSGHQRFYVTYFFLDRNTMFLRVVRLRKISENRVLDQTCLCKGRDNLPANRAKRLQLLARGLWPRKRRGQKSASLRFLISGKTLPLLIIRFQR